MIRKLGLGLFLFFGTFSSLALPASEQSSLQGETVLESTAEFADAESDFDPASHSRWQFLGCVHDHDADHECEHLAEDEGYHHSRVDHHSRRCRQRGHTHACFGRD